MSEVGADKAVAWRRWLGRQGRRNWLLPLMFALLVTLAMELMYQSGGLARGEALYTDLWHRLAGKHQEPTHVGLVMIDDATLAAHPDEPLAFWTPHFARAIGVLEQVGVKVIALDFLFSGSPERWIEKLRLAAPDASRDYDQAFRQRINGGRVLLGAFRVGEGSRGEDFVLPSPDYLLALPDYDMASHIGLTNLRTDADGVVRRFAATEAGPEVVKEGLPRLAFAWLTAVRASGQEAGKAFWQFGGEPLDASAQRPISFIGPPGSFHTLSFQRLLLPDAALDPAVQALAGKAVIIGAGYAGMNDVHPTPYSTTLGRADALMPGPELQANAVETLLSGHFLADMAAPLRWAAFALSFIGLALWGSRLPMLWTLALALSLALGWSFAAYGLFRSAWLFPLLHLQLGLALIVLALFLLRLTREERERARIGVLFSRYVSPQVVEALIASRELPELGGTGMSVTVLFSDIRNFTTISEQLTPKEVVEMLNTYFQRACSALQAQGATIDKFIGDAIMAEFGAPLPQADHARRALRAAVALRAVAVDFRHWMQARFADRQLPEFDIGIGLYSGEAVVGNIGSSQRMEYTAIGDTVNAASRLEGMTKETKAAILASQATVEAAGAGVSLGQHHLLHVKGRVEPVSAYEVLGIED